MNAMTMLDREAIARACDRFGVARLRIFGSAVTGDFDPNRSDLDFFVDFLPDVDDLLGNYLALNEELERILGREVDLVMSDAVKNPYFAAAAFPTAKDVYAA
ncbi:nucleotidyltransferase domain-containing protein [Nocardioides sp.]|uniref:nucleotidyltransferase family protein n=1 Tax=Nocardioides sp. TaxID=35761 RepID=UPI0025D82CA9|nr:nucleotidyltransferase domain-containing protein [Nocardioides sp.]